MKTITSKDLRNNMDKILARVNAGEDIIITHRYRQPVKLSLVGDNDSSKKELAGLKAFDAHKKIRPNKHKTADIKKLYKDHLEEKYGAR